MFCKTGNPLVSCVCSAGHSLLSPASLAVLAHRQTAPLTSRSSHGCGHIFYFCEEKATAPAASLQGAIDPTSKLLRIQYSWGERAALASRRVVHPAPTGSSLSPASTEVCWPPSRAAEGTGTAATQGAGPALAQPPGKPPSALGTRCPVQGMWG